MKGVATMKRMITVFLLGAVLVTQAKADDKLLGSWVKERTQQEDHAYPGDTNWKLEVTFRAGGHFVWHSTRTEGTNTVDESITGTFSVKRGMITFLFDKPSSAAHKRLPEWFAFWPSEMKGQQSARLDKDALILGHDGNKLWFHMKRKTVEPKRISRAGEIVAVGPGATAYVGARLPTPRGQFYVCEGTLYWVDHGDSLTAIAERFDVPLEDLVKTNCIRNPDRIFPGQQLMIPVTVRARYVQWPADILKVKEPIQITAAGIIPDGGTLTVTLRDRDGHELKACLDGRMGTPGVDPEPRHVYIGAGYVGDPNGRKVLVCGPEESALYGLLLRWAAGQPRSKEIAAMDIHRGHAANPILWEVHRFLKALEWRFSQEPRQDSTTVAQQTGLRDGVPAAHDQ